VRTPKGGFPVPADTCHETLMGLDIVEGLPYLGG